MEQQTSRERQEGDYERNYQNEGRSSSYAGDADGRYSAPIRPPPPHDSRSDPSR